MRPDLAADLRRYANAPPHERVSTECRRLLVEAADAIDAAPSPDMLRRSLHHLREHDSEYHHVTPPDLLADLRAATGAQPTQVEALALAAARPTLEPA